MEREGDADAIKRDAARRMPLMFHGCPFILEAKGVMLLLKWFLVQAGVLQNNADEDESIEESDADADDDDESGSALGSIGGGTR